MFGLNGKSEIHTKYQKIKKQNITEKDPGKIKCGQQGR